MKAYLILRSFNGSQDGIVSESFEAGTTKRLSDSLVRALGGTASGFVKEADAAAAEIANAPADLADAVRESIAEAELQPRELADGEMLEEGKLPDGATVTEGERINPADLRETKVVEPAETKPMKRLDKMSKAELVTYALTVHGIELTPDMMTIKEMIAAIEAHMASKEAPAE